MNGFFRRPIVWIVFVLVMSCLCLFLLIPGATKVTQGGYRIAIVGPSATRTPTTVPVAEEPAAQAADEPEAPAAEEAAPAAPAPTAIEPTAIPAPADAVDHNVYAGYPIAGQVYNACVWVNGNCTEDNAANYNMKWTLDGRLWQENLRKVGGEKLPHVVSFTIHPGKYEFNGIVCKLYINESRTKGGDKLIVENRNGFPFEVKSSDGGQVYGKISCDGGASSGADIWLLSLAQ